MQSFSTCKGQIALQCETVFSEIVSAETNKIMLFSGDQGDGVSGNCRVI